MSQQEEPPFDAEAFVARMDANTAARRKAMADKPGGDAVLIVAVCRSMLAVNKPEWEPWLSNIEGLIAHIDTQARRLATLEDEAAAASKQVEGLKQELAEQEVAKLALVQENERLKQQVTSYRGVMAARAANMHEAMSAERKALWDAEHALANCYDVIEWPANGQTEADAALAQIRKLLYPTTDAPTPAPLAGEAGPAVEALSECQNEYGPCQEHCGQCKSQTK